MKQRILIVEDEPVQAMKLQFVLEQAGYDGACCRQRHGCPVVSRTANPVDLVISDVMMPEMDGYTLCRRIRQSADIQEMPGRPSDLAGRSDPTCSAGSPWALTTTS